jgi:hypothetical protein
MEKEWKMLVKFSMSKMKTQDLHIRSLVPLLAEEDCNEQKRIDRILTNFFNKNDKVK